MVQMFGILASPLGYAMKFIYGLIQNYGVTIIIFTVLVRLLMLPLSLKQQKSQARMSAFQPMIQEIQKKWANDKQRQQQELMKFQEENNLKMTAGCLPMVLNMVVLFGIIAVIQAPMQHILKVPTSEIAKAVAIVQEMDPESDLSSNTYTMESILIGHIKDNPEWFTEGTMVSNDILEELKTTIDPSSSQPAESASSAQSGSTPAEQAQQNEEAPTAEGGKTEVKLDPQVVEDVRDFKFTFAGLNLANKPVFSDFASLILPILSILTMIASQVIVIKTSGQTQGQSSMWIMTIFMGVMFGWFAFTVPAGFSLYYTASNVVMTVQQLVVRRIHDPEKVREEIMQEIEERKRAKKAKKKVKIKDEKGNTVEKEVTENELARIRLEKAREEDAKKYAEEEADKKKQQEVSEKIREIDEEKYGTPEEKGKEESSEEEKD